MIPYYYRETIKEGLRWVVLFIASWWIAETLKQMAEVPEFLYVHLWVFKYMVPIRDNLVLALTLLSKVIDKLIHEMGKYYFDDRLKTGITRF